MKKKIVLLVMVVAGGLWPAVAATHDVDIVGFAFSPSSVFISAGDSVRWTQRDGPFVNHTSTSGEDGVPNGLWDSGDMNEVGDTFTFAFNSPGTFPYFCAPHYTTMIGSVGVQGNVAPTVAITSPTNGANIFGPTNLPITASASDSGGSVTQVEFFDGASSLGIDTTSPYSVTNNLSFGSHVLTAVATDNEGARATSAPVNITIRSVPIDNPIAARIPKGTLAIELQPVVDGLPSPLGMVVPDDGSRRMLVYDQSGIVFVVTPQGALLPTPMLDLRSRLVLLGAYDERGLLGMAAHPDFAMNPLIYTYTSESNAGPADFTANMPPGTANHQSVITEWRIDAGNTNRIDPASRREVMRIDQPQSNHNGGTIRFGPDGLLYIALGDGGAADDQGAGHEPEGNAQNLGNVYGKFLRIDVDARTSANGQYGVPPSNPFVGVPGVDEIYAYGFRNPYTFSFDRMSGAAYVADVGQNRIEEIDILASGGNFGWRVKEGTFYFDPNGNGAGYVTATPVVPVPPNLIDPIAEYDHDDGLAVVGGYVYRGSQVAALQGRYVFGDWGTFNNPLGRLFYLDTDSSIKEFRIGLGDRALGFWLKGFGEDADGELYVFGSRGLGPSGNTGRMFKIVPVPDPIDIVSSAIASTNLDLSWTGGSAPYGIQRKAALNDPMWINSSFSAPTMGSVPRVNQGNFVRVADTANQPAIPLTAILSGAAERPNPVTNTTAAGSGTFALEGNVLSFNIRYTGLSAPSVAAHIHGPAGAAGSATILIDLAPYHTGPFGGTNGTFSGSVVLTATQKAHIMACRTYVNVHSGNHPGGEIRGQIVPVLFQTFLNGANERPNPVNAPGTGSGTFALVGNQLAFNISYRNLSGTATASHIHGPANESQSTGFFLNFSSHNGGAYGSSGNVGGSVTLTPDQLAALIDGLTYVNFHTVANPPGEIRGQIRPQTTAVPLTAHLLGENERPTPVTNSTGNGSAIFALEGNTLNFNIRYAGLSANSTAAHIHGPALASQSATVMIDLAPYHFGPYGSASGTFSGRITLTAVQKAAMLAGMTYVNVHSTAHPGGEIRGQIAPVLMQTSLSGGNERPSAIASVGSGSGHFTLVGNQLGFNITYRDLSGVASAAHIHGPAGAFGTAGVLINFAPSFNGGAYGISGGVAGITPLVATNLASIIDGLTYANFHTGANPGGEIRGQIIRY